MRLRKPRRTDIEKREIYDEYTKGDTTIDEMCRIFKISSATIYKIVRELEHEKSE